MESDGPSEARREQPGDVKEASEEDDTSLKVTFTTKMPAEWRVPESPIAVPVNLTRWGLSEVVNHLLGSEDPTPFDFTAGGRLLRGSLGRHVKAHGVSVEDALELEYFPASKPPEEGPTLPHDDWVAALAVVQRDDELAGPCLFSGCLDGAIWAWDASGSCLGRAEKAHTHGIAACAPTPDGGLVTAGKDGRLRQWQFSNGSFLPPSQLDGHGAAATCVASRAASPLVASGGWDAKVLVHTVDQGDVPKRDARKFRRADASGSASAAADEGSAQEPLLTLSVHAGSVTGVTLTSQGGVATASWDHSAKLVDIERSEEVTSTHGSKAFMACDSAGVSSPHLVALCGADKRVSLWDTRTAGSPAQTLGRHDAWPVAVEWRPESEYHLATAGYDGTVKLWDCRGSVPLHTLQAHSGSKALSLAWCSPKLLASGGSDCRLALHSFPS